MHKDRIITKGKFATTGKGMKTFAEELQNEMLSMGMQTFIASEAADHKIKQKENLTVSKMKSAIRQGLIDKKPPKITMSGESSDENEIGPTPNFR